MIKGKTSFLFDSRNTMIYLIPTVEVFYARRYWWSVSILFLKFVASFEYCDEQHPDIPFINQIAEEV